MRELIPAFVTYLATVQGVANRSEQQGMSPPTQTLYRGQVGLFLSWLEQELGRGTTAADFTLAALVAYNNARRRANVGQRTRASSVCALKAFGRWLALKDHIAEATRDEIVAGMKVRISDPARRPCATDAQVTALFAACDRVPDTREYRPHLCAAVLACLAYCGLRRSELCALDYDGPRDVDLEGPAPTITVRHGKGDRMRVIPLHPTAVRLLRAWLEFRPEGHRALFAVQVVHTKERPATETRPAVEVGPEIVRLGGNRFLGVINELCALAKVPRLVPHSFRRFFATKLLEIPGCTIKDVQLALGHSSPVTTYLYCSSPAGKLRKLIVQMDPAPVAPAPVEPPPARRRTDRTTERTMPTHRRAAFRRAT